MTIVIFYCCDSCDLVNVPLLVESRGPTEDVGDWMRGVVVSVSTDHHRRSPECHPKTITTIKIPYASSTGRVGDPTLH